MQKGLSWRWGLLLVVLLTGLACAQFARTDHSARGNEMRTKFGAVYMTTNNPFYEIIDEEIRTVVENNGDVLISRDPALNADRQIEEIRALIAEGVRVLFINPVDGTRMNDVLRDARAAGVVVIAIDTNIAAGSDVAATVVSDNYNAGRQCAAHLLAHADGARIALLKHAEARSAEQRIEGFRAEIAQHPSFQIVAEADCSGQLERAMPAMEKMLMEHPEIDTVMALNDPAALGAIAALQSAGRMPGGTMVYGVDGVPESRELIRTGWMTATAVQSPRGIGRMAAEEAYRILSGESAADIDLPTRLLTRANMDENDDGGWD